jgi:hypothetical protein
MATSPRLVKVWPFDSTHGLVNQSVAQQGTTLATNQRATRLIWASIQTRAGWSVDYSCDSVAAGTKGDAVDRWDSDSDCVFNTPGSAHSWKVLKPNSAIAGASANLLIDLDTSSGSGANASVFVSFSGFTGGSTTARPTASDEFEITVGTAHLHTVNGTYTYHVMVPSDGTALRVWVRHDGVATGPVAMYGLERIQSAPSAITTPAVGVWDFASPVTDNSRWLDTAHWKGFHSGSVQSFFMTTEAENNTELPDTFAGTDLDGQKPVYPSGLFSTTLGPVGFIADWWFIHDSATDNNTVPSGTGREWIILDEILQPWDKVTAGSGSANVTPRLITAAADAKLISVTPAAGELGATFDAARWTPIVLVIDIPSGFDPAIWGRCGTDGLRLTVYEGALGYAPAFAQHSTVVQSGERWTFSILPNGGWWGAPTLVPGLFKEAA